MTAEQASDETTEGLTEAERCSMGRIGLPACQPGVRATRYWCAPCLVKAADRLAAVQAEATEHELALMRTVREHYARAESAEAEVARLRDVVASQGRARVALSQEVELLRAERDDLRALRLAVEALADEWERPNDERRYVYDMARDLRAVLASPSTHTSRTRCDTRSDTGRVPWMIEGDPNCYQEPDADGMLQCPDCTPSTHTQRDTEVHWEGDAPTSLHGNGAGSFARTSRDEAAVTCRLCLSILAKDHADSHAQRDTETAAQAATEEGQS